MYELSKQSGIPRTTLYNQKQHKRDPRLETEAKVIKAFGISVGQFWGESDASEMSEDQRELERISRDLEREQMSNLIAFAKGLSANKKK